MKCGETCALVCTLKTPMVTTTTSTSTSTTTSSSSSTTWPFVGTKVIGQPDTPGGDRKRASCWPLTTPKTLRSCFVYVSGNGQALPLRAVVYRGSGGRPTSLVATSATVTVPATQPAGWLQVPMPPAPLAVGEVCVGAHNGSPTGGALLRSFQGPSPYYANGDVFVDGPAMTFGTAETWGWALSAYCEVGQ